MDKDIPKLSDSSLTKVILYGDPKYSDIQNHDMGQIEKLSTKLEKNQPQSGKLKLVFLNCKETKLYVSSQNI